MVETATVVVIKLSLWAIWVECDVYYQDSVGRSTRCLGVLDTGGVAP